MNTTMTEPQPELDDFTQDQLPGRPRRKLMTKLTVPLLALLLVAAGFLGGIELEKSRGSGSSTTGLASSSATSSLRARFASGFPGAGGSSSSTRRSGASAGGFPGGGAGFPGGFAGAGGGTTGTISSISGDSVVLKTTSGNSIKVTLTSATTLKKDLHVKRNAIRPGDTITVTGITAKNGSMKASSISDSGASTSSSSSSGSSSSSSTSTSSGS
ncbi:MAG TPA: DUF5666 domain-containing protein [Solirubrobacteraceae bacterium]|jgi:hypothetical protein